jgi:hypothetical protein
MKNLLCCIPTSLALLVCTFLSSSACTSKNQNGAEELRAERTAAKSPAASDPGQSSGPGIDLNCVMERIQNPQESFSYSFTKDTSDDQHIAQEAEITPQSIDGRARHAGSDHASPFQATRSDDASWRAATANLTAIAGMSSTISVVNHGSAMKREADGTSMNGFQTMHYSIDTSRFDTAERGLLGATMGPGGYEKGDAWVTSEGCPAKLILDSEMHKNDGTFLEHVRYEESMSKK